MGNGAGINWIFLEVTFCAREGCSGEGTGVGGRERMDGFDARFGHWPDLFYFNGIEEKENVNGRLVEFHVLISIGFNNKKTVFTTIGFRISIQLRFAHVFILDTERVQRDRIL